jgi:hypothetical protein
VIVQTETALSDRFALRVRDTFLSPARLVQRLRGPAPWLDVLLISTVVALLSVALMPDEVFTASMSDPVTRRGEPVEITSSPEAVARWGRGMGLLATIATHPLIAFTLAGILTLLFSVLGRGRASFQEYLSLSSHGLLIPALGTLIAIAIRLATGAATGSLGITALFDPATAPNLLSAALLSTDPFIIWMMGMVALAVHAFDPRHSRAVAVLVLVGGYLVFVFTSTALLHPEFRSSEPLAPETVHSVPAFPHDTASHSAD